MTREEAVLYWERLRKTFSENVEKFENKIVKQYYRTSIEAIDAALTALRGPTKEQMEKMCGCEYCAKHTIKIVYIDMDYNDPPGSPERLNPTRIPKFCPICGKPLTDKAVEMLCKKLEVLKDAAD